MKSKFGAIMLSALIAFALWAYVVTVQAPESEKTYYNIPVVLDGQSLLEARDLMIVSQKSFHINLSLTGYRTDLNKLDSGNITVLADLSQITTPGTHTLNYTVSYPGSVQSGNIHPVNQEPQQITLTVVERSTKDIPVNAVCVGSPPKGYTADRQNIILKHNTITVTGPKEVIDQIEEAEININVAGKTQTITETAPYTLRDKNGREITNTEDVTANVSTIQTTVKILKLKEVPLKLHVIPGGGITQDMITLDMERSSIMISGSESALENLNEIMLGTIDLGEISGTQELEFTVTLPTGVNNVTGMLTVKVSVEMPKLETRTFTVDKEQFVLLNTPEGLDVVLQTEQLIVSVRGPVMLLDELRSNPDRITVRVDLGEGQAGSGIYVATVEIQGMEAVGAVGLYEVNVELVQRIQQPEEPEV